MLYRSIRARDLLEIFFVSAVFSLLLVRFFLYITGYPQLGGDGLHIAHMLWGGLLMLVSITLLLAFLGRRVQQLAAVIGGLGFGVFIDEIGKFITSDNNYFFRPTIGILYAIFVSLFLIFSYISRNAVLSSREYQLNALAELEEAVSHDMDQAEKTRVAALLKNASQASSITTGLIKLLETVEPKSLPEAGRFSKLVHWLDSKYKEFWSRQNSDQAVKVFFIGQTLLFLSIILLVQVASIDELRALLSGTVTYGGWLIIGEIVSAIIASAMVLKGALHSNIHGL